MNEYGIANAFGAKEKLRQGSGHFPQCRRERTRLGSQRVFRAVPVNAVFAPPHEAALVAFQKQMPQAAARVRSVRLENGREHGFSRHERGKDFALIADVVWLNSIECVG